MSTYVLRTESGATYILDLTAMRMTRLAGTQAGVGLDLPAESFDLHGWQVNRGRLEAWVVGDDGRAGSITTTPLAHMIRPDGTAVERPWAHAEPIALPA